MPVRLFLGYFVALAACATLAFASFGIDSPGGSESFAAEQPYPALPAPDSPFRAHPRRTPLKHVHLAQAE